MGRVACTLRGGGQPLTTQRRIGGEPRRPLVRSRTGRVSAAPVGPDGCGFHRVRSFIVEAGGGSREMPGAPVGVLRQHVGERPVHGDAIGRRGTPIDRGSDQRVPECDGVGADPNQLRPLGWLKILEPEPNSIRGGQQHTEFTGVLGRGDQQRQSRPRRQPVHLGAERIEYPATGGGQRGRDGGGHR